MRIQGQMKMGYYPADPALAQRIGRLLEWPVGGAHVLDPSCGKAEALLNLGPAESIRYGVELDRGRYGEAAAVLTPERTLYGGFEQTAISARSFGAVWLNPPYDNEIGGGKRTELDFAQRVTPLMVDGGVLVFFFSVSAWRNDRLRSFLAGHFENLRVFEHPPTDRSGYADIDVYIAIGAKRRAPISSDSRPLIEALIEDGSPPLWKVPAGRAPAKWSRCGMTDAEICELADRSPLWRRSDSGPLALGRPLLPLKIGHIPMVLASGRLNGQIHDHYARAKISKEWQTKEVKEKLDEKGNKKGELHVQQQKVKLEIRCLVKRAGQVSVKAF